MRERQGRLDRILNQLNQAREREGFRLSRLLHDEIGQTLSAVGLHLDLVRMDVETDHPDVAQRITACQEILEQALEQVRRLTCELHPEVVRRAGCATALSGLAARFQKPGGPEIRLNHDTAAHLTEAVEKACYRIAEQAIDNAVRHAGASLIEVTLGALRGGGGGVRIADDGAGFDLRSARREQCGLGLLLMKWEAERAGLTLRIRTAAGKGTIVRARVSPGTLGASS